MVTVTTLPRGRPFTADDLDAMPDDGHRYELLDGTMVVTPAPSMRHQLVSSNLHVLLVGAAPSVLRVLAAPTDVRLSDDTVLQPDLLVVPRAAIDVEPRGLSAVLLAVEILSPSTRHLDLTLKRARYEEARCPAYWVVDPDALELTAWELHDDAYVESAHVTGDTAYAATDRSRSRSRRRRWSAETSHPKAGGTGHCLSTSAWLAVWNWSIAFSPWST